MCVHRVTIVSYMLLQQNLIRHRRNHRTKNNKWRSLFTLDMDLEYIFHTKAPGSEALISRFRFRYDIDTIVSKWASSKLVNINIRFLSFCYDKC